MGLGNGHIGQPLGFKAGFGEGGGFAPPSGDSLLPNALANHFYYDKLVVGNGGVEDFNTYYGVSLATFKTAINTAFDSLDSTGLTAKIKRWTPRIGSIANTQRLNAISELTTYDGTFSGGITYSTSGASYDGTNGYENTNFPQDDYNNYNDCGVSFKMFSSNFAASDGVIGVVQNGVYTMIQTHFSTTLFWTFWSAPDWLDNTAYSNGYWSYSRIGNTLYTYKDGVIVQSVAVGSIMLFQPDTLVVAARKVDGVNVSYSEVGLCQEVIHDGLTAQETEDLYDILLALDTSLGR